MWKVQEAEASGFMPSADKITATCLLFVPSFAERLYQGDISNWKLLAGKEKRKTTLDHWRVKIMTTVIWQLFKRGFCCLWRTFPPCDNTAQWVQAPDNSRMFQQSAAEAGQPEAFWLLKEQCSPGEERHHLASGAALIIFIHPTSQQCLLSLQRLSD